MKANDLNKLVPCPICGGEQKDPAEHSYPCRRCGGSGEINRYGPEDQGPHGGENTVVLYEFLDEESDVLHVQDMPITNKSTGGFDERYGPERIDDLSEPPLSEYQQDMKDRLQNKLGENLDDGEYKMPNKEPYHGTTYSVMDMYNEEWPADNPDLSIDYIIFWLNARGDYYASRLFEEIRDDDNYDL